MKRSIVVLTLLLALAAPAVAAGKGPAPERQLWMGVSILSLTEAGSASLGESATLEAGSLEELLRAGKAVELETVRFATTSGGESSLLIGEKHPLVYYDEKTSNYQVVFVDLGMKLNVRPTATPGDRIDMDFSYSLSDVEDYRRVVERDTVTYFPSTRSSEIRQSVAGLKDGATVVVADLKGASVGIILENLAKKRGLSTLGSRLIVAVTPQLAELRPPSGEAKGNPSSLELNLLSLPPAVPERYGKKGVISGEAFAALSHATGVRILDSYRVLTSDREANILVGRKYPMTYYSSRSGGPQVTYIDIGLKCNVRCIPVGDQRWSVWARCQSANAAAPALFSELRDQVHPVIYSIDAMTTMELGRGETGVVLAMRGEFYRRIVKEVLFPGTPFASDEELVFTVTPR